MLHQIVIDTTEDNTMKFIILFAAILVYCEAVKFNIHNKDGGPIWIGIQGNADKPALENGGFKLAEGESVRLCIFTNFVSHQTK